MAYEHLTKEQRHVATKLIKIGRRMNVPRRDIITALITGITESNLTNPSYGDADSAGWRQERRMYYKDPMNLKHSAKRFYKELRSAPKGSVGYRAQSVQRSAYPDRYQTHVGEARAIYSRLTKQLGNAPQGGSQSASKGKTVHIPGHQGPLPPMAALQLIQNRFDPNAFIDYEAARKKAYVPGVTHKVAGKKSHDASPTSKKGLSGPTLHGSAIEIGTKVAKRFGLTVTSTTGGTHVPGSYHYQGRAIDISGSSHNMKRAFKYLQKHIPHSKLTELFYDPAGHYYDNGKKISGAIGGHSDHIHLAI